MEDLRPRENETNWNDEVLRNHIKDKIREYRNYLVTFVSVFAFSIASTANGSNKQSEIAYQGIFFSLVLIIFLGLSYESYFNVAEQAKKIGSKEYWVPKNEYYEILSAREFYKECMKLKNKDFVALIIFIWSFLYLILLA